MSRIRMKHSEKVFKEWLDEQPIGAEWTAHDVVKLCTKSIQSELHSSSVRFLMVRFDNVKNVGMTARAWNGRPLTVYRKVAQ